MSYILQYELDKRRRAAQQDYERQQKALDARAALEERGLTPEEANTAVAEWVKTGQWNVPTARTLPGKMEPDENGLIAYGPAQPVQQAIRMRKQQEIDLPYGVDSATGKVVKPQVEEDFLASLEDQGYRARPKFQVRTPKAEADTDGFDIFVDPVSGKEVRREPNGSGRNRTIKLSKPNAAPGAGGRGGAAQDPKVKDALNTLSKYKGTLTPKWNAQKGEWVAGQVSPELEQLAVDAAEFLGLPIQEQSMASIVNDEGFDAWASRLLPGGKTGMSEVTTTIRKPGQARDPGARPVPPTGAKKKAEDWLRAKGAPVTPANVAAVLKKGLVK